MVGAILGTRIRDGEFTYPLDDPHIHLRLGANLAHGTLGMNPGEFASASSSPIWPVLIAAAVLTDFELPPEGRVSIDASAAPERPASSGARRCQSVPGRRSDSCTAASATSSGITPPG